MPTPLRPRTRRPAALGLVALALTGAGLAVVAPPAQAAAPAGARIELLLGTVDSGSDAAHVDTDPTLAITAGVWGATSSLGDSSLDGTHNVGTAIAGRTPAPGTPATAADFGCQAGDGVGYAFTTASDAPGALGSAERPKVEPGQFGHDVFGWTLANDQVTGTTQTTTTLVSTHSLESQETWHTAVTTGGKVLTLYTPLNKTWPAGTKISLVAYCASAKAQQVPGARAGYVDDVLDTDADGYAITSWLQFTTVADPNDATLSSSRFVVANVAVPPTVTLTDSWSNGAGTLTAALKDGDDNALTGAGGTVQFAKVTGGTKTAVGAPVAVDTATGTATLPVTGLGSGQQATYVADYTPDEDAAAAWTVATSNQDTVLAPAAATSTTLVVTGSLVEGQVQTLTATVTPADAVGKVVFKDGTSSLGNATVSAGKATLTKTLPAGSHSLTAAFSPDNTAVYDTSTASVQSITVAAKPAAVVTVAAAQSTYGHAGSTTVHLAAGGGPVSGTVTLTLDGTALSPVTASNGAATVTLPATIGAGSHTLTATYAGSDTIAAGSGSGTVTVAKASTRAAVVISPKKVTKAKAAKGKVKAKVSVTVAGTTAHATGTVTVTVGAKKLTGTLDASGSATLKLPKSTKKKVKVVLTYAGSDNLAGSTATATVKVAR